MSLDWHIIITQNPQLSEWSLFSSVQSLSCIWLFVTPWAAAHQASWPSPTPGVYSNSCPLSQWCHPNISSSVVPFFSCLQSFPASESFQMSQLFASDSQSIEVSASASVLPMNTQNWSPLGWTGWISYCPRDSQESSPTPQFKNINPLALIFLYSPILTSIHNYWENHSLDKMDLCWQSNTFYGFEQMCNNMGLPPWYYTYTCIYHSFTALKILMLWLFSLPDPNLASLHFLIFPYCCFIQISYSWNHTVCSLFGLASFT